MKPFVARPSRDADWKAFPANAVPELKPGCQLGPACSSLAEAKERAESLNREREAKRAAREKSG